MDRTTTYIVDTTTSFINGVADSVQYFMDHLTQDKISQVSALAMSAIGSVSNWVTGQSKLDSTMFAATFGMTVHSFYLTYDYAEQTVKLKETQEKLEAAQKLNKEYEKQLADRAALEEACRKSLQSVDELKEVLVPLQEELKIYRESNGDVRTLVDLVMEAKKETEELKSSSSRIEDRIEVLHGSSSLSLSLITQMLTALSQQIGAAFPSNEHKHSDFDPL
jgi:predicted Holliday junction resolvase-like endonuclease